jgi:quercetin dioxygenase-like cupin family protein
MPFIDTNDIEAREKLPGWRGRIFSSSQMTFAHWDFSAGATIHVHNHEQEEVWHVLEGRLEITIDGERRIAGPGMVAVAPPNAPHEVRALTDGRAIVADHPTRPGF